MGYVIKAYDERRAQSVAVKILKPELTLLPVALERFMREAKTLLELDHDRIVKGYEVGDYEGYAYLIMEYVPGEDLARRVKRDGPLEAEDVLQIATQVAEALVYAAQHGKLHRDIKPANLLMTPEGAVMLADFGLIKDELDSTLTGDSVLLGTPYYISPEAVAGEPLDVRSDIYSLGATLLHLLEGYPCFYGKPVGVILTRHITDDLPLPEHIELPGREQSFRYLLSRMVARQPALRYQTPEELLEALRELTQESAEKTVDAMQPIILSEPFIPNATPSPTDELELDELGISSSDQLNSSESSLIPQAVVSSLIEEQTGLVEHFSLRAGEVLFYEGDESHDFYILTAGICEVLRGGRRLRLLEHARVFFGEIAACLGGRRSATIRMLTHGAVLRVSAQDFDLLLTRHPLLQQLLFKTALMRLSEVSARYSASLYSLGEARRLLKRHLRLRGRQDEFAQGEQLTALLSYLEQASRGEE